ncbi:MAG: leucyl aminopeptidase [bacterium]|nr:leucyl aminopeptidase [bacterium]
MQIHIKQQSLLDEACDLVVISRYKDDRQWSAQAKALDAAMGGKLLATIEQDGFQGKFGEWVVLPTLGVLKPRRIAFLGLGAKSKFFVDDLRKLGGGLIRRARDSKAKSLCLSVPGRGELDGGLAELSQAFCEGLLLSAYRFHAYKGKMAEELERHEVETVTLIAEKKPEVVAMQKGVSMAVLLADATMYARDLVNTPSAELTPHQLAEEAKSVAKGAGISIKLFQKADMEAMGMHATLAIARGSHHAPVGGHLIYKPKGKTKKKIVLVGKAVTFDSGGLSLKSAEGMATMKSDMAGAAAVIALFKILPALKPNLEIHGIFLGVENMPSGNACRPGDVVKAMNGTTIEILNTDAEGRVTLADALSYAATLEPDAIIDLATLTGACLVALGEDMAGLLSNDRRLAEKMKTAAHESGEPVWELPLYHPYDEMVHSKVADLKNTGGRVGSVITAALFLSHFVNKMPWLHLDIAGPSYVEREGRADLPAGGTGYGVRLLARYLQAVG